MNESKCSTQSQQKSLRERERAKTFPSTDDYYENSFLRNWQLKGRKDIFDLSYRNAAAAAAKSLQSCLTLCDPIDGSPPGSAVPGILQARTLEWVAISFSNARKWNVKVKLLSRVWLSTTPWTAALQSSSVHGVFQARKEWVAIAFSKGVHRCVDLSLGFLFCSIDLYFCLCASTILSWWL